MLAVCGLQALYVPLNRGLSGGVMLKTSLDTYIPLLPLWVIPYALTWVIWVVCALYTVWKMEAHLYRALLVSLFTAIGVGMTTFLLYPTYVQRPLLSGEDWSIQWLRFIYANDGAYNAFPSGHVYITALIGFYWSRWFPWQRGFWVVVVALIAASTVLTGQHYLLDPIGGLVLAWAGYHFGLWVTDADGYASRFWHDTVRR
jgi:membrane-associated phospholipid phosphatase